MIGLQVGANVIEMYLLIPDVSLSHFYLEKKKKDLLIYF